MPSSAVRGRTRGSVAASALCGLLLAGSTNTLAWAETTREKQWFLAGMKADEMWRTSTGKGITVAVIDTGVDRNNPDLVGQILAGKDFADGEPGDEYTDYAGHGTGMAGLIAGMGAANSGNGAWGLAPGAKILPIRMPNATKDANQAQSNERFNRTAPEAIRYAADQHAKVINISLGTGRTEGSPQLTAAVKYAFDKGSLVFAAVGNSAQVDNEVEYPAATPGVVGVAAVGKDLHATAESEYGSQVDLAAPGDDMVHACKSETGLCRSHGTSDATALASASAALIWAKHPEWTNNQVLRVMLNTIGGPTDGAKRNDSIGYGIVRPRIALTNPGDPGPANVYPLPDPPQSGASTAPAKTPGPAAAPAEAAASHQDGKGGGVATTPLFLAGVGALGVGMVFFGFRSLRKRRRYSATAQAHAPQPGWGPGAGWPEQQDRGRPGS
ncbi:type VII secretion-associated serine protease mycosin [Streptomyces sp. NBC_00083]|uniref:type VII secretion-associated serine protease mycosin n=1 Tax=Streptomyces sp. NBC_00083 TaxID=2975647 RepID=UPI0022518D6E|nr:type VII secretion-associated serine protease mycosin [Streptomyces sp. NBC_00083]MCX5387876.1 type VII secretion-associated serine protease mycosin [Streptomyces sp. NBC_00083]